MVQPSNPGVTSPVAAVSGRIWQWHRRFESARHPRDGSTVLFKIQDIVCMIWV